MCSQAFFPNARILQHTRNLSVGETEFPHVVKFCYLKIEEKSFERLLYLESF